MQILPVKLISLSFLLIIVDKEIISWLSEFRYNNQAEN